MIQKICNISVKKQNQYLTFSVVKRKTYNLNEVSNYH